MSQLEDASLNYFTEFFEAPPSILGVPVSTRRRPTCRSIRTGPSRPRARALAVAGSIAPEVVALRTYHGLDRLRPGADAESFRLLRSFYRRLVLIEPVARAVREWADEHLDGAFVVGVNVRTGNGHYFGKGKTYQNAVDMSVLEDEERLLRLLGRACRARAPRACRSRSAERRDLLRDRLERDGRAPRRGCRTR